MVKTDEDSKAKQIEIVNKYNVMYRSMPSDADEEELRLERKWRKWADDHLVHALSPNVYRSPSEALDTFRWFDRVAEWEKHFASWERYLVSQRCPLKSRSKGSRLGLKVLQAKTTQENRP